MNDAFTTPGSYEFPRYKQMLEDGEVIFTVIEYSSFFAVRHNESGEEHPMGDGVDTIFDEDGEDSIAPEQKDSVSYGKPSSTKTGKTPSWRTSPT